MKKFTFLTTFLKMVPCRTCVSSSSAVYPVDPAQINLAALYTFRLDSTTAGLWILSVCDRGAPAAVADFRADKPSGFVTSLLHLQHSSATPSKTLLLRQFHATLASPS